ncbi:hypothetical protein G7K_6490-t1 [Saitoella complicata NRRL Y-17804]|uniref:Uncharacterized protein n=1 Tax=Saitoella complicata (strain BCRC 22490 / CBS 7301 / JCM 7358 / NBRC 10748 / NRRL Y-17804) TaxID=698492 RepID=A0A0E9NRD0_SAICN|nr:hypothetical protein G7K_6490-t1 [Saitoella complicata NRRL Y-17804]
MERSNSIPGNRAFPQAALRPTCSTGGLDISPIPTPSTEAYTVTFAQNCLQGTAILLSFVEVLYNSAFIRLLYLFSRFSLFRDRSR